MEVELSRAVKKDVTMWEFLLKNFPDEILVEICKEFNIFESKEAVGRFIEAWKRASNDQPVWETLDFSMLKSDFVKASIQPYVWVHSRSDSTLYNLLFLALKVSQGNIKTLIFHYSLYLTNDQFIYTAIRYVITYNFIKGLYMLYYSILFQIVHNTSMDHLFLPYRIYSFIMVPSANNPTLSPSLS